MRKKNEGKKDWLELSSEAQERLGMARQHLADLSWVLGRVGLVHLSDETNDIAVEIEQCERIIRKVMSGAVLEIRDDARRAAGLAFLSAITITYPVVSDEEGK